MDRGTDDLWSRRPAKATLRRADSVAPESIDQTQASSSRIDDAAKKSPKKAPAAAVPPIPAATPRTAPPPSPTEGPKVTNNHPTATASAASPTSSQKSTINSTDLNWRHCGPLHPEKGEWYTGIYRGKRYEWTPGIVTKWWIDEEGVRIAEMSLRKSRKVRWMEMQLRKERKKWLGIGEEQDERVGNCYEFKEDSKSDLEVNAEVGAELEEAWEMRRPDVGPLKSLEQLRRARIRAINRGFVVSSSDDEDVSDLDISA